MDLLQHPMCQRCSQRHYTLRFAYLQTVYSFLLFTRRVPTAGLWCQECLKFESRRCSLTSAIFGWWGIPWGIIWTLGAIGHNLGGGEQPAQLNAMLLYNLAVDAANDGYLTYALEVLGESNKLWRLPEAEELASRIMSSLG